MFCLNGFALVTCESDVVYIVLQSDENPPFYGIPEHAKPLLRKPKHILKLKNLVRIDCLFFFL